MAAEVITRALRDHRGYARKGLWLFDILYGQLREAVENRPANEAAIIAETRDADDPESPNYAGARIVRERMLRAVSLPANVSTLKELSISLKNLVPLERQALGLEDGKVDDRPPVTINLDMRGAPRERAVHGT